MSGPEENVDELTVRARKRVGALLRDKWRLDELLGVGGMAAVYAATHRNGKRVAIKILHREVAMSDDSRARFLREGYVANAVDHKGAVSVIDDDVTEDGAPFITMELLYGETLDQRVRRKGKRPPLEVLSATYDLLGVLGAAHGKGIVHRDVKPENVFLTQDAGVKILDFGIAHIPDGLAPTGTQGGHSMGTPSFMPPEQARGRWDDVDARSDLWAVGATMFTLLTGHHVHEAETMNEVLLGAMSATAKPIALVRPELPASVCAIVDRALAYDKEQRWQTAAEMQAAVREAYRDLDDPLGEFAREPRPTAASISGATEPAPVSMPQLSAAPTDEPTTRTAGKERAPLAWLPRDGRRLGLAAMLVVVAVGALAAFVVAGSGSGTPSPVIVVVRDATSNVAAATPSPAPLATDAIITVQPYEPPAPGSSSTPAPAPPPAAPHPVHPHRPPAAPPPLPPPPPLAPPAPPAAPSDPLNRRH